ncbi:hypothetical protein [Stenotrophomonas bentonitica]
MTAEEGHYIWQQEGEGGATDSEIYLSKLARRAFLNFWSYSNPHTDESGGRELCDFLVVFGNDIIIFSDKACKFPSGAIEVAWPRWYRSAVLKSAGQLKGAASFIERFPDRIFLDPECKQPLPIPIPPPGKRKIHLVAVTRGSGEACRKYFGHGSSSSLVINTSIAGRDHERNPFMIGWPLNRETFVHVLDELTLDIVLNELDSASDLIDYLEKKEAYLSSTCADFYFTGEEDLLASYISNPLPDFNGFSFKPLPDAGLLKEKCLVIGSEGDWIRLCETPTYGEFKKSKEISYEWDRLIEHQTTHIIKNTAGIISKHDSVTDIGAHEAVLRAMAEEPRMFRTEIAKAHQSILTRKFDGDRLSATVVLPHRPGRAYVLMVLKRPHDVDYDLYRDLRRNSLVGFCRASRLRLAGIKEIVGIASEQSDSSGVTQDFILMKLNEHLSRDDKAKEVADLRQAGIWKDSWTCV